MNLKFRPSNQMTIGAELELQLLDQETYALSSSSPLVLDKFQDSIAIKREIFQSMVEVTSGIRTNANQVGNDLREAIYQLREVCGNFGLHIAAAGAHPFSTYKTSEVYPDARYLQILDKHQWLARKLLIFGLHVHVGMRSGDHAILVSNALAYYLPLLLALSSSSPFSAGEDTHLSSSRSILFEALPNSGQAYAFKNWSDFQEMYKPLLKSGAIESFRDLWWDIRPSPSFGTLEIRICDSPSTIVETEAIVALIHLLCQKIDQDLATGNSLRQVPPWLVRENKWRATRQGIRAELIMAEDGSSQAVPEFLNEILNELCPLIEANNYGAHMMTLKKIADLGSSADRQRSLYANHKANFRDVLKGLVGELEQDQPNWSSNSKKNKLSKNDGDQEPDQCA